MNQGLSSAPSCGPPRSEAADRILRAAEELFGRQGFAGTTMREVAASAGEGLSLVVYHFKTKARLYTAVFAAHRHVTEDRLRRLRQVMADPGPETLEGLVGALFDPIVELLDDPRHQWYVRLVFRQLVEGSSDPRALGGHDGLAEEPPASSPRAADQIELREEMRAMYNPLAQEFVGALRTLLPGREDGFYSWAYLFSLGALTQIVHEQRAAAFSAPFPCTGDQRIFLRQYVVAGLRNAAGTA